ncbi:NAD(P)-binding protein [Gymnopilus junonius]|uniref:NAD(P)-binding protein n=1 Tax=Gymnopilus junonius TaxID=109634 RepID=A0A9P5TK71_GYMJU|nr:NAD(P)-binding protein [Gymnopilus junonius]
MSSETIFLLGGTGYLGSQLLILLAQRLPQFHIAMFVRPTVSSATKAQIKSLHPNLSFVEGTLDDADVIKGQAEKTKYVINCASSDHVGCAEAILSGLETQSKRTSSPPLYIHVSGTGITSDNSRGELLPESQIPQYSDTTLKLEQLPPANPHLECDKLVIGAGKKKGENPVRTIVVIPGWLYGVGEGIKKSTMAVRAFVEMFKTIKQSGTWGPGHNTYDNVHVKDCANGLLTVFEAAAADVEGKKGTEGLYFITTNEPRVTFHEITKVIGDVMHSKGLLEEGGSRPLPPTVTDPWGERGWVVFASNHRGDADRLKALGWVPTETKALPLLESLPREVEVAIEESGVVPGLVSMGIKA